jgi:hypothetical protein
VKEAALRLAPDAANADGEFVVAARMWDADVVFVSDGDAVRLSMRDGRLDDIATVAADTEAQIRVRGPAEGWEKLLRREPPPFYQDLFGAAAHHGFVIEGKIEDVGPYYPALRRLIELLRKDAGS